MLNSSIVNVSSSPSLQTEACSNIWRQTCRWNPSVFLLGGISGSTHNLFISTVISINILREACFRFITSGCALHVSHFALWVCPLAMKMSEIHTFYVIRLACFDKINNLEERRSTNPQAGPNDLSPFICTAATYCSLSTYVFGICHTQLNMLLTSQSRLMNMRRAKCSFSLRSERPAANNGWNGTTSGMNFRSSSSAFNSRSDTPD